MPTNDSTFYGYNFDSSFDPNDYELVGVYKWMSSSSLIIIEALVIVS